MKTLIKGGTLAMPDGPMQADLLIVDGKIAAIGEGLQAEDAAQIDASGCIVMPGAIDTHTHLDLPVSGTVTADDFASGTRAAALGGTTTLLDFATQDKGHTLRQAYDMWRGKMDGKASCDVGFHMAITDWNEQISRELDTMEDLGITSYKFYLAYPALMVEDDVVYAALQRMRDIGAIAGFHCENGRLVLSMVAETRARGQLDPTGHPVSRPPTVEAEAIARLIRIARLADAPVNIVHLSSAEGLQAIRDTVDACQPPVYVETCPQYLLLDDAAYARADGAKFVCSPPLRGKADQEALWGALAEDEIDTIGTDHCSFRYHDQKLAGKDDFSQIPNGLPGIEHRVALLMTEGYGKGRLSLAQTVKKLCENPARLFGLYPRKGILAVDSDADIVIWDPSLAHTIAADGQAQNVDYTPYEGMRVDGGVRDVWLRGAHIVETGILRRPNQGQYLKRKPPFAKKH